MTGRAGRQPRMVVLYSVLRQRVQTYILRALPSLTMVVLCTLANQRVRVRLLEWLTLFPDCPALLHS